MQPLVTRQNNLVPDAPLIQPFPAQLAQGADYSAQFGAQLVQSGTDTVARGNQTNAALMEKLYETRAQSEIAKGAKKSADLATQQGGIGGFILGAAALYKQITDEENRKQTAEQRAKLIREAQAYSAMAPTLIQETEGGYIAYSSGAQELAAKYAPLAVKYDENGNPTTDIDDYIRFVRSLYDPAAEVLDENSTFRVKQARELLDASNQAYASRVVTAHSVNIAFIGQETDPVKRQELVGKLYESLDTALKDMPFPAQMAALSAIMPEISKATQLSSTEQAKLYQRLVNLQGALTDLEGVKKQYADLGSSPSAVDWYRARVAEIDARYGTDLWSKFGNPLQSQQDLLNVERQVSTIREAEESGLVSPAEAVQWTRQHIGVKAFELSNDAGASASFESTFVSTFKPDKSPTARSILGISKQWKEYSEWYYQSQRNVAQLQGQISNLNIATIDGLINDLRNTKNGQPPQILGIFGEFNENLKTQLQQLVQSAQTSNLNDPKELARLRQMVNTYRNDAAKAVQAQQATIAEELKARFGNLGTYGFDPDPAITRKVMQENAVTLKAINDALNKSQVELRQSRPPSSGTSGAQPNFKPAPPSQQPANLNLQKQEVEGKSIYLPFPKGTDAVFTSPIGPRWGRYHAGMDIAVPVSTPLIFYDQGEVVFVDSVGSSGYGKYITVKTPNGRYHRFAHLDSVNVGVGDKVRAGQTIAKTGNTDGTGRSTGPHLHWEIRTSDAYGSTDVVSVSEHMNLIYGSLVPRQARNAHTTQKLPGTIQINQGFISGGQVVISGKPIPVKPKDVVRVTGAPTSIPRASAGGSRSGAIQGKPNVYPGGISTSYFDGGNDVTQNYGYSVLAKDANLRKDFNEAAKRIGVHTQWLVDLWVYENGAPDQLRTSRGKEPTLNRYLPISKRALEEYSKGNRRIAIQESLRLMTDIYRGVNVHNTLEYFADSYYQAVLNAQKGVFRFEVDPKLVYLNSKDGSTFPVLGEGTTRFSDVMNNLGREAGRRYNHRGRTRADIRVHRDYVAGCPFCSQLAGNFITHEVFKNEVVV